MQPIYSYTANPKKAIILPICMHAGSYIGSYTCLAVSQPCTFSNQNGLPNLTIQGWLNCSYILKFCHIAYIMWLQCLWATLQIPACVCISPCEYVVEYCYCDHLPNCYCDHLWLNIVTVTTFSYYGHFQNSCECVVIIIIINLDRMAAILRHIWFPVTFHI